MDRTARLLLDANEEQERGVRFQIRPSPIRPALIVERPGGDRDPDHFAEGRGRRGRESAGHSAWTSGMPPRASFSTVRAIVTGTGSVFAAGMAHINEL